MHEIEMFVIRNEDRGVEIARGINADKHPDSPEPDPQTGKRIAFL
jgi:hypothetical protein